MTFEWYPHPGPQLEFCSRGEFEVLYGGAAGGGKSDCLIMEALRDIGHPRYHGLILRRTFPQLQEIIDRTWYWYPKMGGTYLATKHRWEWPNGAKITLGHMQHEDDKHNYQGKEFQFCGFDELTQFSKTQYLYLISRVRRGDSDLGLRFRSTTNPGGVGHTWVKERFIDIAKPYETYIDPVSGTSRCFIPAKIYDNPTIMQADPEYVRRLESLPEVEKMRLLYGVWDVFEGQVFVELSQRVHGCPPFEVPREWEFFSSFDWGYAKPYSVGYYAIDFDGVLYRIGGIYGCKDGDEADIGVRETPIEVARHMLEYEQKMHFPKMRFRVADPACWSKTRNKEGVVGPSVVEDMAKEGLFFLKADNNRILGKMQCHTRLMMEEEIDLETGEVVSEHPRFQCFNGDKHFWRTVPNLRQNENNPEDVDTDQEDHIYDEWRYACMSRPIIPKKKDQIPAGTFAAERRRLIRAKEYSQRHGVSLASAYQRVR